MENSHPLTVHFPIALLLAALFIETLALLLRRPEWRRVSLWCLGLGVFGAAAAVFSRGPAERGVLRSLLRSDGGQADILYLDNIGNPKAGMRMDGNHE